MRVCMENLFKWLTIKLANYFNILNHMVIIFFLGHGRVENQWENSPFMISYILGISVIINAKGEITWFPRATPLFFSSDAY